MSISKRPRPRRVLIASANPIFREGLRKMCALRWRKKALVVGMPSTLQETLAALETLEPDLVIVDHDDNMINREEFLIGFLAGVVPMRVVLVSLDTTEPVIVYHRQNLTAAQADAWLNDPWK